LKILSLLALCLSLGYSCAPEKGCTDAIAKNYNIDAEIDNSSCTYPSLTENVTGKWKLRYYKTESKDSSGVTLISTNDSLIGSSDFNEDWTGTQELDSIQNLTWGITNNNKINITIDSLSQAFTVITNTPIQQEWFFDSSATAAAGNYLLNIQILLVK
jgi:hypothetical protein